MRHVRALAPALVLILSLAFLTAALAAQTRPPAEVPAGLKDKLAGNLRIHGLAPEDYVAAKFRGHGIVFIGEHHFIKHDAELIRSLIPVLYRIGVMDLGIGEDLPKVVYRLVDPEQYAGQDVLVVGGGDSALEAACSVAEGGGRKVTLSYRGDAFARAKPRNRERIASAERSGRLEVLFRSEVRRISPGTVLLDCDGTNLELRNDAVIVSAGGILPTDFLRSIGIGVETKYGTA